MCNYCSKINFVERFSLPKHYDKTIEYIMELIEREGFIFVEGTCPLGEHRQGGCFIDDIIYHVIKCPICEQEFTCVVNIYRGGGSFSKGR